MSTALRYEARGRRWTPHAILSGFIATICMGLVLLIGFVVASNAGSQSGSFVAQWFYGLAHNRITSTTQNYLFIAAALYLTFGLVWAIIYAYVFEPLLRGPGWLKGLLFSLLPFLLSIVVFLPSLGGGFFGGTLHAGPLPVIGNFILHAAYGMVLGTVYNQSIHSGFDEEDEGSRNAEPHQRAAMQGAERNGAIGILIGLAAGAILGSILGQSVYPTKALDVSADLITGSGELSLAGAVLGASLGALIGSMLGLSATPGGDTAEP
ncbi:MAG TPA: DUF6789 family protein [Chloroflexota bacterium]|nr:DUF6789 family protein [Chloroflexota bacterium]